MTTSKASYSTSTPSKDSRWSKTLRGYVKSVFSQVFVGDRRINSKLAYYTHAPSTNWRGPLVKEYFPSDFFRLVVVGTRRRTITRSQAFFKQWLDSLWTRFCSVTLSSSVDAPTTELCVFATQRWCTTYFFRQVGGNKLRTISTIARPQDLWMTGF